MRARWGLCLLFLRAVVPSCLCAFLLFAAPVASAQVTSIINSPHNLSAAGPGRIRATSEQEICIFCHTPHNSRPKTPLWNRNLPVSAYTVYSSSSLKAVPGQPTGSSKLCLSCHDGTIAVGSVLSRGQPIGMSGGITTLPPGKSNLGTDLSDDHPISFRYNETLAGANPKLRPPKGLPPEIRLDARAELQCTSCHDAHNNQYGSFLVLNNTHSQLCNACHNEGTTDVRGHLQCASCHAPHTAPSRAYLLKGTNVTKTCLTCHSGSPGTNQGPNIAAVQQKLSKHETNSPVDQKDHIPGNVVCNDCHEGHTMRTGTATVPVLSPKLGRISGVNASGTLVSVAQFEYEVCFKCHDNLSAVQPWVTRQFVLNNTRLKVAPASASYHPVVAQGKNLSVPSLLPPWTTASRMYCTDCHDSDTGKRAGGSGPEGPHGSGVRPMLIARYDTTDFTSESTSAYALCYKCHNRNSIIGNQSFSLHNRHIREERTPCSVCHDAHGVQQNAALINFNTTVVRPNSRGLLTFTRTGTFQGFCSLRCHGKDHVNRQYRPGSDDAPARVRNARVRGRR